MNVWISTENKYITEAIFALEKARYNLATSRLELARIDNDLTNLTYQHEKLCSNLSYLRESAAIINITEYRKIQHECINCYHRIILGKQLHVVTSKTVKILTEQVDKLAWILHRLRYDNVLEIYEQDKRS
jgi:hypothetical protein